MAITGVEFITAGFDVVVIEVAGGEGGRFIVIVTPELEIISIVAGMCDEIRYRFESYPHTWSRPGAVQPH